MAITLSKTRPPNQDTFYQRVAYLEHQSLASDMSAILLKIAVGAVTLAGIGVTWTTFNSTIYPYSISQPSSFRHGVWSQTDDQKVDYFYPSLGSSVTRVSIMAQRGAHATGEIPYLRDLGGHSIHQSGQLSVLGQSRRLICADLPFLGGSFRVEQLTFVAGGYVWRLTASYEMRFRWIRSTMLHMLHTFKLHDTARH